MPSPFPINDRLSNVTQTYLNEYRRILDTMIRGMTNVCLTNSISYNFMIQMIPHHQAAIHMSRNLLRYTTNIPLQDIASGIITEQTQSINQMHHIMPVCVKQVNQCEELNHFQSGMNQIMSVMFTDMKQAPATNQLNRDFIVEMVPHHRGAVEMSQLTLKFPICPELVPILQAIITSQMRGIAQMNQIMQEMNDC